MIVYTATVEEWKEIEKKEEFRSSDFDTEGFIHCSYPNQTIWVLNKHYKNEEKVILLCIDPKLLKTKLVTEDLKGKGEEFPHIYGSINKGSVVKVIDISPSSDGLFYENEELNELINMG